MAARRGKSQAKRGGGRSGVPGWIWLLGGLLIGLCLSAFVLLGGTSLFNPQGRGAPTPNPTARAARESEPPVAQKAEPAAEAKPKYDFYTVLAEREVRIPDNELAAQAERETQTPAAATSAERYLLQAGAFADARDAEAVKARLALLGLVARVEVGQVNGKPVHRVRLGPYATARELETTKRQLGENGIRDAIAIRADR